MNYQTMTCGACFHAVPNEQAANSDDLATRLKSETLNSCRESPPDAVAILSQAAHGQVATTINSLYRAVANNTPACSRFKPRLDG